MPLRNLLVPVMVLGGYVACVSAQTQTPTYSNVGRTPTEQQMRAWDISIGPEGKELPPGSGTVAQGAAIFAGRGCAWWRTLSSLLASSRRIF
jgi:hypothetical protein